MITFIHTLRSNFQKKNLVNSVLYGLQGMSGTKSKGQRIEVAASGVIWKRPSKKIKKNLIVLTRQKKINIV